MSRKSTVARPQERGPRFSFTAGPDVSTASPRQRPWNGLGAEPGTSPRGVSVQTTLKAGLVYAGCVGHCGFCETPKCPSLWSRCSAGHSVVAVDAPTSPPCGADRMAVKGRRATPPPAVLVPRISPGARLSWSASATKALRSLGLPSRFLRRGRDLLCMMCRRGSLARRLQSMCNHSGSEGVGSHTTAEAALSGGRPASTAAGCTAEISSGGVWRSRQSRGWLTTDRSGRPIFE